MTTELRPEINALERFARFFWPSIAFLVLATILLFATLISWYRAEKALDAANEAKAQTAHWQNVYKEAEREDRLCQLEVDEFRIALIRAGIELDHGEEKP